MVEPESSASLAWRWTGVFGLNLPLPLPVGLWVRSDRGGLFGMVTAVVAWWLAGLAACYHLPRAAKAVTDGAIFVAAAQVFPACQCGAGIGAILAWGQVAGHQPFRVAGWRAELAGAGITLLTALPLVFAAWVIGGGPAVLFARPVARTPEEADFIDPEPPGP